MSDLDMDLQGLASRLPNSTHPDVVCGHEVRHVLMLVAHRI